MEGNCYLTFSFNFRFPLNQFFSYALFFITFYSKSFNLLENEKQLIFYFFLIFELLNQIYNFLNWWSKISFNSNSLLNLPINLWSFYLIYLLLYLLWHNNLYFKIFYQKFSFSWRLFILRLRSMIKSLKYLIIAEIFVRIM